MTAKPNPTINNVDDSGTGKGTGAEGPAVGANVVKVKAPVGRPEPVD
jgi:hypothetical protein